jgi:hypothetical protein
MKKIILIITTCSLIIVSCKRNRLDVDVSEIKTSPLEIWRLEEEVFAIKELGFNEASKAIKDKFGNYYEHYLMNFLVRGGTADSAYKTSLLRFVNDVDTRVAFNGVKKLYPTKKINEYLAPLNDCVKRFKYHFPTRKLPNKVVTCTAGWNYAFAYHDEALTVGLDMYLEDTCLLYKMLRYPQYQVRKMNRHHLLSDMMRGWLLTEFDNSQPENILLNHCIFYGKIYYAVNALLPNMQDSLIIGYTSKQIDYCKTFEKNVWGFFAEKNRLYENNMNTIRELTSDGPFTGVISKDCPPRIAMWVGWQIVKSYMDKNDEVSLEELMKDTNAQKILSKSKYRP